MKCYKGTILSVDANDRGLSDNLRYLILIFL